MSGDPRTPARGRDDPTHAESSRGRRALEVAHTASFDATAEDGPPPPSALVVEPGTVLAGKYRVVRTIGKGGMGLVVEARHTTLDTRFAIKFLLPEFMSYAEAAGRFLREARAASKLASPHVARVLDVGTLETGEPYMVMEYLAGEDLSYHAHAKTPLSIGEAIDYVVQACDAIADAHDKGIVHRDIKPANLFLTKRPDGSPLVKVLDFGVSKVMGEGTADVSLTQTTTILGSALYMAPEQMQSAKHVDARSDIYALGVCLYEMLARKLPYFAESFPELCAQIFTSPPAPLKEARPEVPSGLVAVIEKALARKPADRWQSVAELVQALSPWARIDTRQRIEAILRQHAPLLKLLPPAPIGPASEPPPAPSKPAPESERGRARWPVFAVVAGLGVAGVIGWRFLSPDAPAPPRPEPAMEPRAVETVAPTASATSETPDTSADPKALPAPSANASAPASASAMPVASASAVVPATPVTSAGAVAATNADPKAAGSAVRPAPVTGAKPPPEDLPQAAPPPPPPTTTPPPAAAPPPGATQPPLVNPGLVQEICRVTLPDGTTKVVPCN